MTLVASGTCTLSANQAGDSSMNAAPQVTGSFAVTLKTQSITGFTPASPLAYSEGMTFALTATGGASGNPLVYASTTLSVCTVSGNTVTALTTGTCSLTANQAGNSNYSAAAQSTASVIINKTAQLITFNALIDKLVSDAAFAVNPTVSSGLTVTVTSATTAVCTVTGNLVTPVSAGTCLVLADQPGNAYYDAAATVAQSFAVNKTAQTISFAPLTGKMMGDDPFAASANASSGLTVALTSMTASVCTMSHSDVTIVALGTCTIAANQPGNALISAAAQVLQSFEVTPHVAGIYYIHPDHLNTPRMVTDGAGVAVWEWESDPFGEALPDGNLTTVAFTHNPRFPGQYYDVETGLHYNYFRDYDPSTGRYVESDPIGLDGGLNTYGYVKGNPLSLIDPFGLFGFAEHQWITQQAMDELDFMCPGLPGLVSGVDFLDGSQDPENSHWHHMSNGTNGQTAAEAGDAYNNYVAEQTASGIKGGLARALHASQDSAASGHRDFQSWAGGLPDPSHIRGDILPSKKSLAEAIQKSKDVLSQFEGTCECKKK